MIHQLNRVARPTHLIQAVALASLLVVFTGCGADGTTSPAGVAGAGSSVAVAVQPDTASTAPGGSAAFAAAVTGTAETQVVWSIVEASGGSIDAAGNYQAPQAAGTYHVTARSVADPAAIDTATVVVSVAQVTPPAPPGSSTGPRMGVNLEGIAFFTKNDAFNNMMTQAGIDGGAVWNPDNRDANGWPTASSASTILRRSLSIGQGTYRISFKAKVSGATASISNCAMSGRTESASGDGTYPYLVGYTCSYTSGDMSFSYANAAGGITAVKVLHPGSSDSDVLSPIFKASAGQFAGLRFYQAQGFEGEGVNTNTEKFWSERRKPTYATWCGDTGGLAAVNGIPYEAMILMANELNADVYLNVPYLTVADTGASGQGRGDGKPSTDDYLTKMAQVFRFGSDGSNPYTSTQANPVYPPLKAGLHVYVEFSNELWNGAGVYTRDKNWTAAAASAEYSAGNAFGYQSSSAGYWHPSADRTGRMIMKVSDLWRAVWGDAAMGTTVRIVSSGWVGDPYSDDVLDYIASKGSPAHYVYGFAVGPYFNQHSGTADQVIASMAADAADTNGGTDDNGGALVRDSARAARYGIKMLAYEGGIGNLGIGSDATARAIQADDRVRTQVLKPYFARWFSDPNADTFFYYTLAKGWSPDDNAYFGLSENIADQSGPKWRAIKEILAGQF